MEIKSYKNECKETGHCKLSLVQKQCKCCAEIQGNKKDVKCGAPVHSINQESNMQFLWLLSAKSSAHSPHHCVSCTRLSSPKAASAWTSIPLPATLPCPAKLFQPFNFGYSWWKSYRNSCLPIPPANVKLPA